MAREWLAKFSGDWASAHRAKVLARLENDLFPWLGKQPIASIGPPELLQTIRRVETRGALDTAHRCLSTCGQIFRYAIASGSAKRNPAADLRGALPAAKGGHFASITDPERVGELLRAIEGYQGGLVTRCALRLASLTFVRPAELRFAEWPEINLNAAQWRIPGMRMKTRHDHIVPLVYSGTTTVGLSQTRSNQINMTRILKLTYTVESRRYIAAGRRPTSC